MQHTKEITQTVVQTGGTGAHPYSSSKCVNADVLFQDNTNKSTFGRPDLTNLRFRLEKTKEEREKHVVASSVNQAPDYHNPSEVSSYVSGNPMIMNKSDDKKPRASHLKVAPTTHSASSTASSKVNYKLWQCAHCQSVNEACHISCKYCELPCGWLDDRSVLCEFCQLLIFIPARGEHTDVCCPRCKQIHETVFPYT